ncbi:MAG: tetratricopeptide repeat protein [Planctomycetota bacterium]
MADRKASLRPAYEQAPSTPGRRRRKLVGVALSAIIVPTIFFLLLEGALAVFGTGYPTGFFVRRGPLYVNNSRFGWRFFPQQIARKPMPISFPVEKPENSYRIFVLGASAAQGFPQPAFGFSRILEVMLRKAFPDVRFEVVNTGVTAINSHVVVDIARDCAKRDPDLFIILLGNNEVIGPYGPTATFGTFSRNRRVIRSSLWIKATRTGQLVGSIAKAIGNPKEPTEWQGMQAFLEHRLSPNDPKLAMVYDHFRSNLMDICRAGENAGVPVILCTVPVNLRDSAPFVSMHRPGLTGAKLTAWTAAYDAGITSQKRDDYGAAVTSFLAAGEIDDDYADLHFRLARCYLALDQFDRAGEHFALARHWDALRFRADQGINDVIRHVAQDRSDAGAILLDAERHFAQAAARADSPGKEFFHEHVHFNFHGGYALARLLFDKVSACLPAAMKDRQAAGPVLSRQRCAEMLALTDWSRRRVTIDMLRMHAKPPFTHQLNNREAQQRLVAELQQLRLRTGQAGLAASARAYDLALQESPTDHWLHFGAAQLAMARRDNVAAIGHLQQTISLAPGTPSSYLHLATAYFRENDQPNGEAFLDDYLQADGATSAAYRNVAEVCNQLQLFDLAEAYCRLGLSKYRRNALLLNMLGETLRKKKQLDHAIETLQKAIDADPNYALARSNLGTVLLDKGHIAEGIQQLEKAIQLDPFLAGALFNLGTAEVQMRQVKLGLSHMATAMQLDPDNATMTYECARLFQELGRPALSVQYYRRTLSISPQHAPAAGQAAWLLATSANRGVRNPPEAIRLARLCVEQDERMPQAWATLAAAYAADRKFDQAIEAARHALGLAERAGQTQLARNIKAQLARYRRRESPGLTSQEKTE